MNNRHIINALPLLASILGHKYGVRVEIGGSEACTNGRVIHLPTLPLDSDEKLLHLVRGFVDHESAHIRATDFKAFSSPGLSPLERHIVNLLEDYRVEHKLAEIFPGCGQNFTWLIRHFFLNASLQRAREPNIPENSVLDWLLLTVRAWDVPELKQQLLGSEQDIDRLFPGLRTRLSTVLRTVPLRCTDTCKAVELARELVDILRDYILAQEQERQEEQDKSSSAPSEGSEGGRDEKSGDVPSDRQNANAENSRNIRSEAQDGSERDTNTTFPTQPEKASGAKEGSAGASLNQADEIQVDLDSLKRLLAAGAEDLPQDLGESLAEELSERKVKYGPGFNVALVKPRPGMEFQAKAQAKAREATTALRTRLSGLLQSRREARNRNGYAGKLDSRRLHKLSVGETKVFLKHGERSGLNTAAHILLDASGSMTGGIELAAKSCFAVASALHSLPGVNVGVTAFPGQCLDKDMLVSRGGRMWDSVSPLLRHGEKMHRRFLFNAEGDTPLDAALWWVLQQMRPLPDKRKLILLITDGIPSDLEASQYVINVALDLGYELYGIGILNPSIIRLLPEGKSRTIQNLGELAPAMFGILQTALLRGTT
jgi:nitric oxide reductase activation protein